MRRRPTHLPDLVFIDTETRLRGPFQKSIQLDTAGTVRYARHAFPTVITWSAPGSKHDLGVVENVHVEDIHDVRRADFHGGKPPMRFRDLSDELREAWMDVSEGRKTFASWHSLFDRTVLERVPGAPPLDETCFIDVMAQAQACNLPGQLGRASTALTGHGKLEQGKTLIDLFSFPTGADRSSHPQEWSLFLEYAVRDVSAMEEVYGLTSPLTIEEWEQFWASEWINDTGVPINVPYAKTCKIISERYEKWASGQIHKLTGGQIDKITKSAKIAAWAHDILMDNECGPAAAILEKEIVYDPDTDSYMDKLSIERQRVEDTIQWLDNDAEEEGGLPDLVWDVRDVLGLRLYGAGATRHKYGRMLTMHDHGRVCGAFRYNGATVTGRFSSSGVQMHNMRRETVPAAKDGANAEYNALCAVARVEESGDWKAMKPFGDVGRVMAALVRPSIQARSQETLVWGDWSSIEARLLPFLANSGGARKVLDVYRRIDADPDHPDFYKVQAAAMNGVKPQDVDSAMRQEGKVAVLALGYAGGVGALMSMGIAYGLNFGLTEAEEIVEKWRAANTWARDFWKDLEKAFVRAYYTPGSIHMAGKIAYRFAPNLAQGTMICGLPCGRAINYPAVRVKKKRIVYKSGRKGTGYDIKYRFGKKLWRGTLAENVTQAAAASLLRETLTGLWKAHRKDPDPAWRCVGHVHDEIMLEIQDTDVEYQRAMARYLLERMSNPDGEWLRNCPIAAEVSMNPWYTKGAVRESFTLER